MSQEHDRADQQARIRALDPATSFIIQAPAGSGKTGLLSQRFLVLLAAVDAPEEIVAITFTRKAAGEMRQRILQALQRAKDDSPPESVHARQTWNLAQHALARDKAQRWQLLENPGRLRILTIDSLCTALARQMPIRSRFGSVPDVAEDAGPLYLEAARRTIAELESAVDYAAAIAHLIGHLDNQLDKLQGLIATMLAQRDYWLRHLADPYHPRLERESLQAALARLVTDALTDLVSQIPSAHVPELLELGRFAAQNLQGSDSPVAVCADLEGLPGQQLADRIYWEGLAELLLTKQNTWRKSLNKQQGFPAPSLAKNPQDKDRYSTMKQRMTTLLVAMQSETGFAEQLALVRELPPHQYTDGQWETVQALVKVLRVAVVHLERVFSDQGKVDFAALLQAAILALGEPEAPVDLALALDYPIGHLLVDEFQDTSFNQYELLKRLTAGWLPGDGRTLFVVGDPMQSIYRFREAEVGLFLAAREHGVGQVRLEFLRLAVNFRSQQGIVDWINQYFPVVLPANDRIASGSVSYAPSIAFHPLLPSAAVTVYPALERDDIAEAQQVVSIVRQAKIAHPQGTTAILVRGRTHLLQIVTQLHQAQLRFQAVEIERLAQRPVVQDLLALTRALLHCADRIAWLAVLRAPYCGLTLEDLHRLAGDDFAQAIIALLHQEQRIKRLSKDAQSRISRVLPLLDAALAQQARNSLRSDVEGLWIALGGPACLLNETELKDAEVYLQLLETIGSAQDGVDIHALTQQVERLFALPDRQADTSLQLMTMHKAKGLQFDTVILPGLGRSPRHADDKLLHWLERGRKLTTQECTASTRIAEQRTVDSRELILAPISAFGEDKNPIAAYLQRLDTTQGHFEDSRLLYVAATRAKQRLCLLGHVGVQDNDTELELKLPAKDSLLARLWSVLENDFQALLAKRVVETPLQEVASEAAVHIAGRMRLASHWVAPEPAESIPGAEPAEVDVDGELVEFDWAGETARHVGTVVHRLLQYIGKMGAEHIEANHVHRLQDIGRAMLCRLGVPQSRLKVALAELRTALHVALEDERGRWILSGRHASAHCELALSQVREGRVEHLVIDRTFVTEDGVRWIIDYKTGAHSGGVVAAFLDREQLRYRQQLECYAIIMGKMENRPIRLGLYFPLLGGWREWAY